jgi:hypothetical protein
MHCVMSPAIWRTVQPANARACDGGVVKAMQECQREVRLEDGIEFAVEPLFLLGIEGGICLLKQLEK